MQKYIIPMKIVVYHTRFLTHFYFYRIFAPPFSYANA